MLESCSTFRRASKNLRSIWIHILNLEQRWLGERFATLPSWIVAHVIIRIIVSETGSSIVV